MFLLVLISAGSRPPLLATPTPPRQPPPATSVFLPPSGAGRAGSSERSGRRRGGARTREAAPSSCRPPFPPWARRGAGAAGAGSRAMARARPVPGADHHAVVVGPGGPRAPQPPGADPEEPREEERAPGQRQQHGCSGSAALLGALGVARSAPRARLGDWRGPPAPTSTLRPPLPSRPAATLAAAGRWPGARGATPRVTRPRTTIGAGRPGGAGSRRRRPWAGGCPGFPGRRVGGGGSYCPPGPERADAAPPTRGAPVAAARPRPCGQRRGSRGFCSVTADASPSRGDPRGQPTASHLPSPASGQAAGGGGPDGAR